MQIGSSTQVYLFLLYIEKIPSEYSFWKKTSSWISYYITASSGFHFHFGYKSYRKIFLSIIVCFILHPTSIICIILAIEPHKPLDYQHHLPTSKHQLSTGETKSNLGNKEIGRLRSTLKSESLQLQNLDEVQTQEKKKQDQWKMVQRERRRNRKSLGFYTHSEQMFSKFFSYKLVKDVQNEEKIQKTGELSSEI